MAFGVPTVYIKKTYNFDQGTKTLPYLKCKKQKQSYKKKPQIIGTPIFKNGYTAIIRYSSIGTFHSQYYESYTLSH
jgi:hypothetical protein